MFDHTNTHIFMFVMKKRHLGKNENFSLTKKSGALSTTKLNDLVFGNCSISLGDA